ncbi:TPA: magnesium/cobalt transporter CorA [Legionella feeleii]|uniref:Magnesium transport protein CorA n=1 Tax=Legionella feeleii TaxID=453 RepID=A0A0W0U2Y8_9GAMM|nr:magnesium/cobalt transporter CorA [Legionella feeleii]KTD02054.1 magnesium and cobalt transport protein CorA [Legionella feeleii]SPX59863.1 magnesium and cobalt transport protein CorA [Legionella feeleii]STX37273.1 magnesium and cobalt transport protein CorA [Legionella feeleii]
MITAYLDHGALQLHEITENNLHLLKDAIWLDLLHPSKEEERLIEKFLNLNIPTREEMLEIELSSRLYKTKEALFMTALMIARSTSPDPKHDAVTFVLTKQQLITIRYIEPLAFKLFTAKVQKIDINFHQPANLLIELVESAVDRLADMLETVGHRLEEASNTIFRQQQTPNAEKPDYQQIIQLIGANADLNTKARECLVNFNRLITFFGQSAGPQIDSEGQIRLGTLAKDVGALSDHANFISSKVNFLLDATLGMINIEQNAIIKIFSVAAVIFLPPTLIASIYGMNFHFMPELNFKWGYLVALGLMILSALIPFKYFKRKKWL